MFIELLRYYTPRKKIDKITSAVHRLDKIRYQKPSLDVDDWSEIFWSKNCEKYRHEEEKKNQALIS